MNKVILMGRLTRDPDYRQPPDDSSVSMARYTLAVDRRTSRNGEQTADFISCVTFGKNADFAEKYLKQGTKVAVTGRIQTGSYTNRDGQKVYTTDVVVEDQEFAESRNASADNGMGGMGNMMRQPSPMAAAPMPAAAPMSSGDGFMNIPDGIDEELPFN